MQHTQASRLKKRPIFWFYGSASIAYGIKDNAFGYLLLIFANQCLGVPGYLASSALAIAMIWDAVSDPLLGHWSDKTRSKLGRRHPFMYAALLILPGSFYGLFNPVIDVSGEDAFFYILFLALLIRTGTTLFEVPSTALLPDLEKNYDQRNRWLALRHFFGWTGGNGFHAINFTFWIGTYGVASATGYAIYGTVGAIIIALTIIVSSLGTQRAAAQLPQPTETFKLSELGSEFKQIYRSLKNRNFAALFSYGLFMGSAAGLGAALYLYNVTYFFEFTGFEIAITAYAVLFSPWLRPTGSSHRRCVSAKKPPLSSCRWRGWCCTPFLIFACLQAFGLSLAPLQALPSIRRSFLPKWSLASFLR